MKRTHASDWDHNPIAALCQLLFFPCCVLVQLDSFE